MDENKSFARLFLEKTVATFVPTILVFSLTGWVLSLVSGDAFYQEIKTVFGYDGLSYSSIAQLFALSVILGGMNTIFLSDIIFKKAMLLWRYIVFAFLSLVTLYLFALLFRWLPIDLWIAWVIMPICFMAFFLLSSAPFIIATKLKDRQYGRMLDNYKTKNDICQEKVK